MARVARSTGHLSSFRPAALATREFSVKEAGRTTGTVEGGDGKESLAVDSSVDELASSGLGSSE